MPSRIIKLDQLKKDDLLIFTDGSCPCNNRNIRDDLRAGIGIYCPKYELKYNQEVFHTITNNYAELYAIFKGAHILKDKLKKHKRVVIVSDNMYAINSYMLWTGKREKNPDMIRKGKRFLNKYPNIVLCHIKASHGAKKDFLHVCNDKADILAKESIDFHK